MSFGFPVVVIGAARSGTNLLRDVIAGLPGFGTWPCDEINYIWRHGNRTCPHDEFGPELARPEVIKFISQAFSLIARQTGAAQVVEKTCANSLRVEFVNRVLPDARYVFVVRDGRDVVVSALKRWTAPLQPGYILAKARYVPLSDVPYYATRYLGNRLYRLVSREQRLASWGPRFVGMRETLEHYTLAEVAAMQWVHSVLRAEEAFTRVDPARIHRLRYEDFVCDPHAEVTRLAAFLERRVSEGVLRRAVARVSAGSVGKWQTEMDDATVDRVLPRLEPVLRRKPLAYA